MSRWILGISAFYHDAAAALLRDGDIVAAAQEERFSRKKHDPRFPIQAINYCLEEAFIDPDDLDAVVFYDRPDLTWDRVVKTALTGAKADPEDGASFFQRAARTVLGHKIWVRDEVERCLGTVGKAGQVLFTEHHFAHAASAFYPSPFERAAILTVDGVGEWTTTALGRGDARGIQLLEELRFPHSLGLLYSAFTAFCGFKVNSGEYKLMGLAPYGEPRYVDRIKEHLIDLRPDGSFRLDLKYFDFLVSERMTNEAFAELFDGPPRARESALHRREMDLAASIQVVTEEAMLGLARRAKVISNAEHLVMAGGVALNCVANGKLLREGLFDDIWIQPAAGDAGGALGAAYMAHHAFFGEPRTPPRGAGDRQKSSLLGPAFSSQEIKAFLERGGFPYEEIPELEARAVRIATALEAGKIVGLFAGRAEYGPRALGARSILGDPRRPDTQTEMNLRIKYRESFRPFAPAVLAERVGEYFDLDRESPYMLLVADVAEGRRRTMRPVVEDDERYMLEILNQSRSDIPAVTHIDYSARVQSVADGANTTLRAVLEAFEARTGCGVIINTSFNVRGEPIVGSPRDAYLCFMRTGMDLLVLESCLLEKAAQPDFEETDNWRESYELD